MKLYHNPEDMMLLTRKLNTNHRKFTICYLVDNSIEKIDITPFVEYYLKEKDIWKKYTIY